MTVALEVWFAFCVAFTFAGIVQRWRRWRRRRWYPAVQTVGNAFAAAGLGYLQRTEACVVFCVLAVMWAFELQKLPRP